MPTAAAMNATCAAAVSVMHRVTAANTARRTSPRERTIPTWTCVRIVRNCNCPTASDAVAHLAAAVRLHSSRSNSASTISTCRHCSLSSLMARR
ncbi:hypothetical protein Hsero_0556 [Herbaspirillum seropedicae SmR1]|uniref:Uncharacterized protein n=1 Tax=Herbaspirillum seropedicae (strain SmR1) TaxID=757424 RepID=D8IYB5_HERSS|nr:hypothetical protein Hsero_0556 [Herbaspirillum seropedicae SmR1]